MNPRNTDEYKNGYDAGVKLACELYGLNPGDAVRKSAFVDATMSSVVMQNALCKVASAVFEEAGMAGCPEHVLYTQLAERQEPLSNYCVEQFVTPVAKSLTKEAMPIRSLIGKLLGGATASVPAAMQTLAVGGVAAGVPIGALAWALNRDSSQEDMDAEAKEEQAAHYRSVARDLKKRLKFEERKKTKEDKELENAADDAYLI